MAKSYCKLDKKGMEFNFDGCVYPDSICSKCSNWIPEGKEIKHLIDKDAILAEIERLQDAIKATAIDDRISKEQAEAYKVCVKLRIFVEDSIEVKEVDLDKEMNEALTHLTDKDMRGWFRYFFELGLKASSSLTWEDMMTIHKCCKDAMNCNLYAWETAEGQQKIYEDVLKRFKAQKGE